LKLSGDQFLFLLFFYFFKVALILYFFFFFQAEDGIRDRDVTGGSDVCSSDLQVSISNSIGSLRLLGAIDWQEFVETRSFVEQILREDPSGVYPKMDFATRDRY